LGSLTSYQGQLLSAFIAWAIDLFAPVGLFAGIGTASALFKIFDIAFFIHPKLQI